MDTRRKWIFFGDSTKDKIYRVHVIDTITGQEQGVITGGQSPTFAPDNKTLAVCLQNGDVQLWDLPLRKPWGWIALASGGTAMVAYFLLSWWAGRRRLKLSLVHA